jgi:radical SAM protein with 4Fe4S-binding SPASM domain
MKFKKIYIEITNICNFHCSFCYDSQRPKRAMTVEEFRQVCEKVRPHTNYLYLHVMGEPLLHPYFAELMQIATEYDFQVNITTNGSLIPKQVAVLKQYPARQINLSLHDLEENIPPQQLPDYIQRFVQFAQEVSATTYINLRLWNRTGTAPHPFTQECLRLLEKELQLPSALITPENLYKGIHLKKHIYLQIADRFDWPHETRSTKDAPKTCYALKDHIAILCDGSIVPCCLDADAHLLLGNIFTDNLSAAIKSEKALRIKEGFRHKIAVEDFCKKCGFR